MEDIVRIELFGILLVRPNNLLTNLVVAVFGYILFKAVRKQNTQNEPALNDWSLFFLMLGIGGGLGGFAHAFNYDFPEVQHTFFHKFAWTAGGFALFFGERAAIRLFDQAGLRKALLTFSAIKLTFYVVFLYYSQFFLQGAFNHFDIVRINSAIAILGLMLPSHLLSYLRVKNPGRLWVIAGILSLTLTVVVYNLQISLHRWFDFNDISHAIEIVCVWMMFKGVQEGYHKYGKPETLSLD